MQKMDLVNFREGGGGGLKLAARLYLLCRPLFSLERTFPRDSLKSFRGDKTRRPTQRTLPY